MEKEELFQENFSNAQEHSKKADPTKRQHIKKDTRRKDKRKRQSPKPQPKEPIQYPQPISKPLKANNQYQAQTSKYQRLQQFWKIDIENLYRKQFNEDDKQLLRNTLNQKKKSIIQVFKNNQSFVWNDKISFDFIYKYLNLVQQFKSGQTYSFAALEHQNRKEHYVLVLDQDNLIQKAVQVSEQQLDLIAYRQQCIQKLKMKSHHYNLKTNSNQKLSEIQLQITFLFNYAHHTKQNLDAKLMQLDNRANQEKKYQSSVKVEEQYIAYLIKKNVAKALQNQDIDYFNHFKKLDILEHTQDTTDLKPINDKKQFDEYIRKRKIKKNGKKARWVLKTACGGCLSYFNEMYNPFSFCTECHTRYHKYCYIPKNQNICESCFQSKNNIARRSRINECQLCGIRGFLYLPMDQSNNAHIFCMVINGLWRFENTQIVFQKRYIENAIENQVCEICKQSNSCIYKCNCCEAHAHPLCAFLQGWDIKWSVNQKTKNQIVKVQCCSGVQRQKNQKRRRFILNYKKCLFSQCQ